jgi:hypothetical protein
MLIRTVAALAALAPAMTSGEAQAGKFDPSFDGAWSGTVKLIDPNTYNPVPVVTDPSKPWQDLELAIEIEGQTARVYVRNNDKLTEVKPGAFGAATHRTNAIVAASDSALAPDQTAGWVETWNLTLTHKDDDALYVFWMRAANNYHLPAMSNESARFFAVGSGELTRTEPIGGTGRFAVADEINETPCRPAEIACGSGIEFRAGGHIDR